MSYNNYSVLEEELSNNFASLQWQLLALELSRISIRKQLFENGRFSKNIEPLTFIVLTLELSK